MTPGALPPARWLVDGNNVMGARPDGWWRDRAGAARRLVHRLSERSWDGSEVVVFFDGPGQDESVGVVTVHHAGPGQTADDAIAAFLEGEAEGRRPTKLVTSDRELARRGRARGAEVVGAGHFLGLLADGTEAGA